MAGITQNRYKRLIFIVVLLLRVEKVKERWEKIGSYIQSKKNICKLRRLIPNSNSGILTSLIHCLFKSDNFLNDLNNSERSWETLAMWDTQVKYKLF